MKKTKIFCVDSYIPGYGFFASEYVNEKEALCKYNEEKKKLINSNNIYNVKIYENLKLDKYVLGRNSDNFYVFVRFSILFDI